MNKNQIKTGTAYAYAHADYQYRWGRAERVEVLQTGATGKDWRGNTYTGSHVRFEDGTEQVVRNRTIREEWEPFAERKQSAEDAGQARAARAREDMQRRVVEVAALIPHLADLGIKPTTVTILWRGPNIELIAEGLPAHVGESLGFVREFTAPLAEGLAEYLTNNRKGIEIPSDTLATLVALR